MHVNCLLHTRLAADGIWRFIKGDEETTVKVAGSMKSNSVAVLRDAALEGLGVALLPVYSIADELADGRIVRLFTHYEAPREGLFVLFPYSEQMPKKVRLFVDFLARMLRKPPWEFGEKSID
jgi:DNA-binding transcriptional LysR family regulator